MSASCCYGNPVTTTTTTLPFHRIKLIGATSRHLDVDNRCITSLSLAILFNSLEDFPTIFLVNWITRNAIQHIQAFKRL